jgi:ATP-dependent Lon protease
MARKKTTALEPAAKKDRILLVDSEGTVITVADLPNRIPIFPVYQRPIFPGILTMVGADSRVSRWIREHIREEKIIGLLLAKPDESLEEGDQRSIRSSSQLYRTGTVAYVLHWVELPDESCQFMLSTLKRFRVKRFFRDGKNYTADVEYIEEVAPDMTEELRASAAAIVSTLKELIPHNPTFSQEMHHLLSQVNLDEPITLTDLAASMTNAKSRSLQKILETQELGRRMEQTLLLLREEYDLSLLKEKISQKIDERLSKHQREFFLREQLKEIKMELGLEQDRKQVELERFRERFELLEMTEEAEERVEQELRRYEFMDESSPESQIVHQYLETIAALPWNITSEDKLDLTQAKAILDEDHYGLDDVKKRILEFIAVSKLKGRMKGGILCLVGPPGVGKTSLGRSIAKALGREFYRFSVGGLSDENELKGHRRTYIGAMPGRLIQALRTTKTMNPVIMLDELDKAGRSFRGDPYSVLLEVLDPEQNKEFLDHYLDLRFDLSQVLFIATANTVDTIPDVLRDRMETLRLAGYVIEEKLQIAEQYLIPKILPDHGLTNEHLQIPRETLRRLTVEYAREVGVRNLEKKLRTITRKMAMKVAADETHVVTLTPAVLTEFLGQPDYPEDSYKRLELAGLVRGLAWTPTGGSTLPIESILINGTAGEFKLTGQLGEVMKESSAIAYSYVQSLLRELPGKVQFFKKHTVHLHVPEGATPKDGPSAGIAMATSLLSLALERPVPASIAMTGELTLSGQVLPIGGVREKVVGARLAGIHTLLFPVANQAQYDELPEHLRDGLVVHFVTHFREVAHITLNYAIN